MQFAIEKPDKFSPTTGFLIFCIITTFGLSIYLEDSSLIAYGILILLLFSLASSLDKGSTDKDLAAIGWSNKNLHVAIPYGIIGGLLAIIIGSLLIAFDQRTASILVPDFSATAAIFSASVISPNVAFFFNILSQIFIVSPSEESLARILGPLATFTVIRDVSIAYFIGSTLWIIMHIPAYSAQNAPAAMYFVLGILSIITIALLFITKNIFSSITAHATFNVAVLSASSKIDIQTFLPFIILIAIVIALIYIRRK